MDLSTYNLLTGKNFSLNIDRFLDSNLITDNFIINSETKEKEFYSENGKLLAVEKTVELKKHDYYQTLYYNEELSYAVDWKESNSIFDFIITDNNDKELKQGLIDWYWFEPACGFIICDAIDNYYTFPLKVRFIKYVGEVKDDVLLRSDGSILLKEDYTPEFSKSIVTKDYVSSTIDSYISTNKTISQTNIELEQIGNISGIKYNCVSRSYLEGNEAVESFFEESLIDTVPVTVKISKFVFLESQKSGSLGLLIDNIVIKKVNIEDIINNTYDKDKIKINYIGDPYKDSPIGRDIFIERQIDINISISDITSLIYNSIYGYKKRIYAAILDEDDNIIEKGNKSKEFVICSQMNFEFEKQSLSVYMNDFALRQLYKEKISCLPVINFIPDGEQPKIQFTLNIRDIWRNGVFPLNRMLSILCKETNETLEYNLDNIELLEYDSVTDAYKIILDYKVDLNKFKELTKFSKILSFYIKIFNNIDMEISGTDLVYIINENIDFESNEYNRLITPSSTTLFPAKGTYGDNFYKKEVLEAHDLVLFGGVYTSDNKDISSLLLYKEYKEPFSNMRLCFYTEDNEFSIQVKVGDQTGWLNASKLFDGITTPIFNDDACTFLGRSYLNNGFYKLYITFGKKVYKDSIIYVRLNNFSKVSKIEIGSGCGLDNGED